MKNEAQYQIFIGYNDSQTKDEFVTEKELTTLVSFYFERNNVGFSIMHGKGGYLYEDGRYILEHTMIITIIGEQDLDIEKLARGLSMYMNQECLMVTRTSIATRYS